MLPHSGRGQAGEPAVSPPATGRNEGLMAVESERPVARDGTWDMCHGSWVDVDDGAVTLHLVRPEGAGAHERYMEDLDEASRLLKEWGLDPDRLANKGFDEDGDLFELV
jgi:hypothetical protein